MIIKETLIYEYVPGIGSAVTKRSPIKAARRKLCFIVACKIEKTISRLLKVFGQAIKARVHKTKVKLLNLTGLKTPAKQ